MVGDLLNVRVYERCCTTKRRAILPVFPLQAGVYVCTPHFAFCQDQPANKQKKTFNFQNGPREQGSSKKAKSPVGAMTLLCVHLFVLL
jgi:hypothetical protein